MEKIDNTGSLGAAIFHGLPTPSRQASAPEETHTEEVQGAEDVDTECAVSLFTAEQGRAHEDLIEALASQLSECRDSDSLILEASWKGDRFWMNLAGGVVVFVMALMVSTLLALVLSSAFSSTTVAPSVVVQQAEVMTPAQQWLQQANVITPAPVIEEVLPATAQADSKPSAAPGDTTTLEQATDLIQQLWGHGHGLLQHSRCQEAQPMFANALSLLAEHRAISERYLPRISHKVLIRDQAFAMICANEYKTGADILEQLVVNSSSVYINALGYARFMLKDYRKAGAAFQAGVKADPHNKILWNNLASAKLLAGDIRAADDAMYQALNPDTTHFQMDPWYTRVFLANVNVIAEHAMGQKSQVPSVEIWYAPN